jgi:hypothetical protein
MARVRRRTLACCTAAVLALGGCGVPPELRGADRPPRPSTSFAPSGAASAPVVPDPALPPPGVTGFPIAPATPWAPPPATRSSPSPTATPCTGGPTAAQVLAAVRRAPGVPSGATLRVTDGPYCAGGWQYAEVGLQASPQPEPLLVITRGRPGSLRLVEIGTDVCSDKVTSAPPAVRALACG